MIDHIYLPVKDIDRSLQFYTALLTPLDFAGRWDFKGQDGWPDLSVRVRRGQAGLLAQKVHDNVSGALCSVHRNEQGSR